MDDPGSKGRRWLKYVLYAALIIAVWMLLLYFAFVVPPPDVAPQAS